MTMPFYLYNIFYNFMEEEKERQKEFKRRAEEARKLYWDACKLPRKKKKAVRKEARADFYFYSELSKPIF